MRRRQLMKATRSSGVAGAAGRLGLAALGVATRTAARRQRTIDRNGLATSAIGRSGARRAPRRDGRRAREEAERRGARRACRRRARRPRHRLATASEIGPRARRSGTGRGGRPVAAWRRRPAGRARRPGAGVTAAACRAWLAAQERVDLGGAAGAALAVEEDRAIRGRGIGKVGARPSRRGDRLRRRDQIARRRARRGNAPT